MAKKYFVIADIHGRYDKLIQLMKIIRKNGFSFKGGHVLVQLGDMNDRGPDTFRIINFFYKLNKRYPDQVINTLGNHERMLLDAASNKSDLMYYNGGQETLKSYCKFYKLTETSRYALYGAMNNSGHFDFISKFPLYHETEDYFFCHAPVPKSKYRRWSGEDFRKNEHTLTWSYVPADIKRWVDPDCTGEGKISLHGHIHGLKYKNSANGQKKIISPGIRKVKAGKGKTGMALLIDTGCGCCEESILTCVQLPDMLWYNTNGKTGKINE